jgi:hypothetical protein
VKPLLQFIWILSGIGAEWFLKVMGGFKTNRVKKGVI